MKKLFYSVISLRISFDNELALKNIKLIKFSINTFQIF